MNKLKILFFILLVTGCTQSYDRSLYKHWIDVDKDCQNTRAELLIKKSLGDVKFKRVSGYYSPKNANLGRKKVRYKSGKLIKKPCNITNGLWRDPYGGKVFSKASKVQIDHIVPLKQAHISGASSWTKERKREFSNDEENLLVVEGRLNQRKGAKAPHEWMPPLDTYHCTYIKKWSYIKKKYQLTSSTKELNFVKNIYKNHCLRQQKL